MKKRFITLAFGSLLACMAAQAQSSLWLYATDGTQMLFELKGLKTLTFEEGMVMFRHTDGTAESRALSEIRCLAFNYNPDNGTTGIRPTERTEKTTVRLEGNLLTVCLPAEKGAHVAVHSLDGRMLMQEHVANDMPMPVGNLTRGVYIIRIDGQTFKIVKQ